MSTRYTPAEASEAIPDPYRYKHQPVQVRPPEAQEKAILAHQARIDAARTEGLLLDSTDSERYEDTYLWRPGYEDTARGIQLGRGLGYRSKAAVGREHIYLAPIDKS